MRRTLSGEREQQAAIITYLQLRGWYVIRLNNQPIFDPRYQQFWRPNKYTPKGMADLLALKPAQRPTFVEVKGVGGRLTKEQQEFKEAIIGAGADYLVARSIDDVQGLA